MRNQIKINTHKNQTFTQMLRIMDAITRKYPEYFDWIHLWGHL